ncbi:MAG: hypothetical protein J6X28_01725 [Bacilli bacterium]|nr:hypothetical protein [Bacilli bacterium]
MEENTNKEKKKNGEKILIAIIMVLACISIVGGILLNSKQKETEPVEQAEASSNQNISEEEAIQIGTELWEFAFDQYWDGKCDLSREEVRSKFAKDTMILAPEPVSILNFDDFIHDNQEECKGAGREKLHHYKKTTLQFSRQSETEIDFIAVTELCGEDTCSESSETVETIDMDFYIAKENGEYVIFHYYLPVLPE